MIIHQEINLFTFSLETQGYSYGIDVDHYGHNVEKNRSEIVDKIYEILGLYDFIKYGFTQNLLYKFFGNTEVKQKDEIQIHFATLLYCDNLKNEITEPTIYDYE